MGVTFSYCEIKNRTACLEAGSAGVRSSDFIFCWTLICSLWFHFDKGWSILVLSLGLVFQWIMVHDKSQCSPFLLDGFLRVATFSKTKIVTEIIEKSR